MKLNKIRTIIVFATAIFTTATLGTPLAYAQSNDIQLSPAKTVMDLRPGAKNQVVITVKNAGSATQNLSALFDNFTAADETGAPKIITDASFARGIKTWMSGIGSFSLAGSATRNYALTVSVPTGTKPGTYYGLVRFGSGGTSASVGSLVLINVGDITQEVALEEFITSGVKVDAAGQASGTFAVRVKNIGNGYTVPKLKIEVLDDKKAVIDTLDANEAEGGILPEGGIRRYEADFSKKLEPNKTYSARVTATAGTMKPLTQEKTFVEAPAAAATQSGTSPTAKKTNIVPLAIGGAIILLILATVTALLIRKRNEQLVRMPSAIAPQPTGQPFTPTAPVVGDLSPNQPSPSVPSPPSSDTPPKNLVQ